MAAAVTQGLYQLVISSFIRRRKHCMLHFLPFIINRVHRLCVSKVFDETVNSGSKNLMVWLMFFLALSFCLSFKYFSLQIEVCNVVACLVGLVHGLYLFFLDPNVKHTSGIKAAKTGWIVMHFITLMVSHIWTAVCGREQWLMDKKCPKSILIGYTKNLIPFHGHHLFYCFQTVGLS